MPRKPPLALRIVNRLGKLAPGEVTALLDATDRLRSASGDGLRDAMHDQQLAQVAERAEKAAAKARERADESRQLADEAAARALELRQKQ